jgi:dihydrofolate reductase
MKVIVIFVTTLDGKITKWGDPHVQRWSSKEDQSYFKKAWDESKLTVIGSSTFDFDPIKPSLTSLLVVMTSKPEKYKKYELAKHLEFSSETPKALTERFTKAGYEQMLVVGGPHVATSFFKDNLIDELWLTLEPKIFGKGGNFVIEEELDIELELLNIEKINERGTLIAKYKVLHS